MNDASGGSFLGAIFAARRIPENRKQPPIRELRERARTAAPVRDFTAALRDGSGIIAEIKRASPSRGDIAADIDVAAQAADYAAGGASAISVLTEPEHFRGSPEDLILARASCPLPVLRKDFLCCEADIYESRSWGADAVLLIVAGLDDAELAALHGLALELGMSVLVEIHDQAELERALDIDGLALLGVNSRNLHTLEVSLDTACELLPQVPGSVLAIAESGIAGAGDITRLHEAGAGGYLIGETLMRTADPAAALGALAGAARTTRSERA
ncbi:MAG: indole-3-glycerol-phosphate synthase [Gammaproteobacteria bacterium AqS3]|nr:indole-3-glycerol-phosphate synthase [Gammaproteobacteria bacterium AqS3]